MNTPAFGRLYTLDGAAMACDREEFVIHECLVHMAALMHPSPARALVLGGGDGASARELLKHPGMRQVVVAELDPAVVRAVCRHIPALPHGSFDDPRVDLRIGDAALTLGSAHQAGERFDLILFDLTEPDDPACAHLHGEEFLKLCAASLAPHGIIQVQLGSPAFQSGKVRTLHARLAGLFPGLQLALLHAPLYGGPWLIASIGGGDDPAEASLMARLAERQIRDLRYYNPAVHAASRALPTYIHDLLA
ncbi:fused MFS/spermidine synthase [Zoogloea sp.]|uniref:fused MFS/spermidine synthase n=1 Tax=Zoogloea sp. TaxID=49181 RepID=UPI0031FC978D